MKLRKAVLVLYIRQILRSQHDATDFPYTSSVTACIRTRTTFIGPNLSTHPHVTSYEKIRRLIINNPPVIFNTRITYFLPTQIRSLNGRRTLRSFPAFCSVLKARINSILGILLISMFFLDYDPIHPL